MSRKKILILNGSHSEMPLIESAKKLNLKIYLTGNNPYLIGNIHCDEYIKVDFADKDRVLEIAKKIGIDFICAPCHDLGLISSSYVANNLNLPGYDYFNTTKEILLKDKFKNSAKLFGLQTPKNFNIELNFSEICLRSQRKTFIVKPVDLGGGKGISKIQNQSQLNRAKKKALSVSRSGKLIIEEFVIGTLHSLSTFIFNKKVIFYYHDNELCLNNQFGVSTSYAPSNITKSNLAKALKTLENYSKHMNLSNGILHAQLIQNKDEIFFIELTRRCSGDLYTLPVQYSTNINLADIFIKLYMGEKINKNDFLNVTKQKMLIARHCLMAKQNGKIKDIFICETIKENIIYKLCTLKKDCLIKNFEEEKFGVFVLKFKTNKEMVSKVNNINNLIFVRVN